jgi:hypothetical protein
MSEGISAYEKVMPDWPPAFWDNLSKLFITPRALREFDRRTSFLRPSFNLLSCGGIVSHQHLLELERFAKHGGPCLDDLHNVSHNLRPI